MRFLKNSFELLIAFRYLRSKRKESFISIVSGFSLIGIALGVATLIIVMSVMNGYHVELLKRILGINGHITITNSSSTIKNYDSYVSKIKQIDGVTFVAPVLINQTVVSANNTTSGALIRSMDAQSLQNKPLVRDSISLTAMKQFEEGKGLILGVTLAKQLNVKAGDFVKIISSQTSTTIAGSIPRMKTYKVIGTFDVGMYEYNVTTIFMPIKDAQLFFQKPNAVSDIEVMVKNPENLEDVKAHIAASFNEPLKMVDWAMINSSLFDALAVERNVMFLILTLIIIVAAFNIISSLIMLVKDKATNIAILRTMGASKKSVLTIFIICGSLIGFIGTIFGAMLGILFSMNIESIRTFLQSITGVKLFDPVIYFLTQLPSSVDFFEVMMIICISLLISLLATIYPAWRAARLMPAEVLRYE